MGMTLTVNGWADAKGDGENADGTLFPALAVKSEFETLDDQTGTVTLAGCEIGETYVWEILGSAKDATKDCTDMTYWIVGGGTGTVDVVDNTDTLVYITNVATTASMILYCTSPNAGEDSFLNAIRISGPAGDGLDDKYAALDDYVSHTNLSLASGAHGGAAGIAAAGGALAETVVTGAVVPIASGNRYFFASGTNIALTTTLTSGQVCNYASIRNSATNSITATGPGGWNWFSGSMTNTIAAGKTTVFGLSVSAENGATNGFAVTQGN